MTSYRKKTVSIMLLDSVLVNIALLFVFRTGTFHSFWSYIGVAVVNAGVLFGSFYLSGVYRRLRYFGMDEMVSIIKAVTAGTVVYALGYHLIGNLPFQWGLWANIWMTITLLTGGVRLSWRLFQERKLRCSGGTRLKPVLIIGAGDAGALVARALLDNKVGLRPVGFIDDDPEKWGLRFHGVLVLGPRQEVTRLCREFAVEEIVIAIPSASQVVIRELVSLCRSVNARLKILPSVVKLLSGPITPDQIRDIRVEDLLQREPVNVDLKEIADYLHNQVVLVTGAGGSIGSELCRLIADFNPATLVILGHGEYSIFELKQELADKYPAVAVAAVIADVRDFRRMESFFQQYRPGVVFHAAAHKHVSLMEDFPEEAFQNNVLGTRNVTKAASLIGTKVFVYISSDKAVNPSSVMGATKKAGELIVNRMNAISPTKYVVVRFGNVLGSRGSVLPLFQRQIAAGGPVTVTHPEMSRFFMTVNEAAQLVIQAGAMAEGGETFVLDMGEPVKIVDLAKAIIGFSGCEQQIDIVFTQPKPGEKLEEELFTSAEGSTVTRHKRILITQTQYEATERIDNLISGIEPRELLTPQEALNLLKALVPTFKNNSD